MSPSLGLSLHEKRKGQCLFRTFGPSSRDAQVQAAERRLAIRPAGRDSVCIGLPFLRGASAL